MYNYIVVYKNEVVEISTLKVFISYSSSDKDKADEICSYLERHGKKCWIAPRDIPVGTEYGEEIINGIENSDVAVLVFSKAANESQHVLREVERAVSKKIPIVAFKLEDCTLSKSMEYFLLTNQWLDATSGAEKMLQPLSESIEKIHKLDSHTGQGVISPASTIRVSNRAVPIMLGIIAVGIMAVAAAVFAMYCKYTLAAPFEIPQTQISAATTLQTQETSAPEQTASQTQETQTSLAENTSPVGEQTAPADDTNAEQAVLSYEMPDLNVGEFISFGRYYPTGYSEENNDGELTWQIVREDEELELLTLVCANIIDIKPFDCAESGKYDYDNDGNRYDPNLEQTYTDEQLKAFRGNGEWAVSDIRMWLNSSGNIAYMGRVPIDKATDECGNSFGNQRGFLSSFTKTELDILCENLTGEDTVDTVFLPSVDEIELYRENSDFILYPDITASAAASDSTTWYNSYFNSGLPGYIWATRTQCTYKVNEVYVVDTCAAHELYTAFNAASSGLGIRPALSIRYDGFGQVDGDGTEENPYYFVF